MSETTVEIVEVPTPLVPPIADSLTFRERAERIGKLLSPEDVVLITRREDNGSVTFHIVISEEQAPTPERERNTQALYTMTLGLLTYASKPGNTMEAFRLGTRVLAANADIQQAIKDEVNGRT